MKNAGGGDNNGIVTFGPKEKFMEVSNEEKNYKSYALCYADV